MIVSGAVIMTWCHCGCLAGLGHGVVDCGVGREIDLCWQCMFHVGVVSVRLLLKAGRHSVQRSRAGGKKNGISTVVDVARRFLSMRKQAVGSKCIFRFGALLLGRRWKCSAGEVGEEHYRSAASAVRMCGDHFQNLAKAGASDAARYIHRARVSHRGRYAETLLALESSIAAHTGGSRRAHGWRSMSDGAIKSSE